MPKSPKKGLSYFTVDCNIFEKTSDLRPLMRRFKADGLAIYIHILCDVYANGYYFQPADYEEYLLDLSEDCGCSVEKVKLVLAFMQERTLLRAFTLDKNTVFTSHGIQMRYCEAMKGRKKRIAEIKGDYWLLSEEDERNVESFYKTAQNLKNENKSEKISDKSEKISDKSEKITQQNRTKQNIYIPPLSPNGGREEWKDRFFSDYPKLKAIERLAPFVLDYEGLYQHFQRSEFLRTRFSAKWVMDHYPDIIAGFHDEKPSAEEQARARAEWYRQRRERAEEIADVNRAKAEERCGDIIREIKRLEIAISKAEARGEEDSMMGEAKALLNERDRLEKALAVIGLTESDLRPRYRCRKCSDTGYLPNGKPCDCYEKLKGEKE